MEKTRTTEVAPLIEIKQLNKYYQTGDQPLHVLNSIDLTIYRNDFVSIMGPSGSGKSTLINVLGFLDHEFEGDYLFEGQPIEQRTDQQISKLRNQIVGFVFQDFNLIGNMTVEENVRLPLIYKGLRAKETKELVQTALDRVGLGDKLKQKPSQLSGGQKQRLLITRALASKAEILIFDDSSSALDFETEQKFRKALEENYNNTTKIIKCIDVNLKHLLHKSKMIICP